MGKSRWKGKRKMAFIKNIDHETVLNLADQIHAEPGQIVSKTLAQNKAVSLTLFAFSKGEEISTHDSTGDAMVHVIDGRSVYRRRCRAYLQSRRCSRNAGEEAACGIREGRF